MNVEKLQGGGVAGLGFRRRKRRDWRTDTQKGRGEKSDRKDKQPERTDVEKLQVRGVGGGEGTGERREEEREERGQGNARG